MLTEQELPSMLQELFKSQFDGPWSESADGTLSSPNCTFVMKDGKILPKVDTSVDLKKEAAQRKS